MELPWQLDLFWRHVTLVAGYRAGGCLQHHCLFATIGTTVHSDQQNGKGATVLQCTQFHVLFAALRSEFISWCMHISQSYKSHYCGYFGYCSYCITIIAMIHVVTVVNIGCCGCRSSEVALVFLAPYNSFIRHVGTVHRTKLRTSLK